MLCWQIIKNVTNEHIIIKLLYMVHIDNLQQLKKVISDPIITASTVNYPSTLICLFYSPFFAKSSHPSRPCVSRLSLFFFFFTKTEFITPCIFPPPQISPNENERRKKRHCFAFLSPPFGSPPGPVVIKVPRTREVIRDLCPDCVAT